MDKRELLDRTAHSPEERLLLSRVWDKCEQCRTRNIPTATGFLSPAEQAAAQGFLVLLGARAGAGRRAAELALLLQERGLGGWNYDKVVTGVNHGGFLYSCMIPTLTTKANTR